jgi:undecaprenyl-diphosphatase
MEVAAAVILGIVQGLTEFLPISSSAHLIVLPWLFGWKPEGLAFDVVLHFGTALAVLAYFWSDWVRMARAVFRGLAEGRPFATPDRRLAWFLAVGTLPAMLAGIVFEDIVEDKLRSPLVTVITLIFFGFALYYAERRSKQTRHLQELVWTDAVCIGLSQAIALIPGVSRSGVTITAGMLRNCERKTAARFSFLLSTPVIVGAGLLECGRLFGQFQSANPSGPAPMPPVTLDWGVIAVGTLFAAVTGFLCIRYFLRYLESRSFTPFVVYRFALAAIILMYYIKYCLY